MQVKAATGVALVATLALVGCDNNAGQTRFVPTSPEALHYSYPLNGQEQVAPDTILAVNFRAPADLDSADFVLTNSEGQRVVVGSTVVDDGRSVVLRPEGSLQVNETYELEMVGVSVDGVATGFRGGKLSFTTRAALPGADAVSRQKSSDTFEVSSIFPDDELFKTMDFSSFRMRTTQAIDKRTVEYGATISLNQGDELVDALLLVEGNAITVDPVNDLMPDVEYELVIDGLVSTFGDPITPFSRTVVPLDTTAPGTGLRSTLVTEAPPTDPVLGCRDEGVRLSPLTGLPINCVPIEGTILQDKTSSKQSGLVFGELAFAPNFPDVTPLRVKRGGVLSGDALEIFVGGEVPVGFDSGEVLVEIISDAVGYLFPNPNSDSEDAPKNLRLFMDVATSTADARANGAFTQNLMHLELVGQGLIIDGVLEVDAITVVEPSVLGVENNFGLLSFRMESLIDQENAPMPAIDAENPFVPVLDGELSWMPGNNADRLVPGEPIIVHFNEALDPMTIRKNESLFLERDGMLEPFHWELRGNALVVQPDQPFVAGSNYALTTTPDITDLAGNPLMMLNSLDGSNTLSFDMPVDVEMVDGEDVRRSPFPMVVYPGFPCATSENTAEDIANNVQGACLSSSPDSEQVAIDILPIVNLPANRAIRVRFSRTMDESSMVLGESFIVEREVDGAWEAVDGFLEPDARALTFTPDQPWEDGALYRYILRSNGGGEGCTATSICSADGLPLQTALLLATGPRTGGPDMEILFRGEPATKTVFAELNNLPSADVNNNFDIDPGEPRVPEGATDILTPANAVRIEPDGNGGGGLVIAANTGCGFEDLGSRTPEECESEKFLYIAGALNTEIIDFDEEQGGVPVLIYPTAVALTNLDAEALIGISLAPDEGSSGLLGILPEVGDLLSEGLSDLLAASGLDEVVEAVGLDNIALAPIGVSTGPNIMRVRYNEDENGVRNQPVPGVILPPAEPGGTPIFRITFDLLFDAPGLELPLGLDHNVKSLPIPGVTIEGPVEFLPDGRLFIGLFNLEPQFVELDVTLGPSSGGKVQLVIPPGGINLSYQTISIQ